jgi:hydroxyacylglutathione hydrolase
MKIYPLDIGTWGNVVYVIEDELTKKGAVIDPTYCTPSLVNTIKDNGITLEYILITHGHFDHIGGIDDLKAKFPDASVAISSLDAPALTDNAKALCINGLTITHVKPDITFSDGDTFDIGRMHFRVLATPGHTHGSVCYITDGAMFSGDTLFYGTVGNTGFSGGDPNEMEASLKKLAAIKEDMKVYPGHGQSTTLFYEQQNNEFLRDLS